MNSRELILIPLKNNKKYFIDLDGNVYSQRKKLHLLKHEIRSGYPSVTLSIEEKKPKKQTIHRLLAITFLPNPENKPCVNHIDGNKENHSLENLEWCTHSENERHSFNALGKTIRHSEKTKDKIRKATLRHKSYLKNFKYTHCD